jgi:hypothetical protein
VGQYSGSIFGTSLTGACTEQAGRRSRRKKRVEAARLKVQEQMKDLVFA